MTVLSVTTLGLSTIGLMLLITAAVQGVADRSLRQGDLALMQGVGWALVGGIWTSFESLGVAGTSSPQARLVVFTLSTMFIVGGLARNLAQQRWERLHQ